MEDMRRPADFGKAIGTTNTSLTFSYLAFCIIVYLTEAQQIPDFMPDVLVQRWARAAVGALLAYHILIAYVVHSMAFHRKCHARFFGATAHEDALNATWRGRLH